MARAKRNNSSFFFGGRQNNKRTTKGTNVDAGLLALSAAVEQFIEKAKASTRTTAWSKITDVKIVQDWLCILTTGQMTLTEKNYIMNIFRLQGFVFNNRTYDWSAKGYRQLFQSSYLAFGPWSKNSQMYNGTSAYHPINIIPPTF